MTSTRVLVAASVAIAAVYVGVLRPPALIALVLIAVFAAALTRAGLWVLGDLVPGDPDVRSARAGAGTFAAAAGVAAVLLALGPASVPVLAVAVVLVAVATAPLLARPGRPAARPDGGPGRCAG